MLRISGFLSLSPLQQSNTNGKWVSEVGRAHCSPFILYDLGLDLEELGDVEDGREDDDGDDVVHHPPPGVVALCATGFCHEDQWCVLCLKPLLWVYQSFSNYLP